MAEYFIPDLLSNSWTFGSILLDPGIHRQIRIRRIHPGSDNSATSFLCYILVLDRAVNQERHQCKSVEEQLKQEDGRQ